MLIGLKTKKGYSVEINTNQIVAVITERMLRIEYGKTYEDQTEVEYFELKIEMSSGTIYTKEFATESEARQYCLHLYKLIH